MSKTATKIGEPARHRDWGLTVDKLSHPTEYVVIHYLSEGRRHTEPFEEVVRLPYSERVEGAISELVERAHMPAGTATSLVFAVAMKLASPKAADAELGHRPVV